MCREGVDTLKINPSGDEFVPFARAHQTVMNDAEVAAVCEVAQVARQALAAHCRSARNREDGAAPRRRRALPLHALGRRGARHAGGAQGPHLRRAGHGHHVHDRGRRGLAATASPRTIRSPSTSSASSSMCIENMKKLKKRGLRILPGGDYGFAWNPIGTNARDIEHFVKLLDYTPMEAIIAATKLGGEIMGMGNELGQIKAGLSRRPPAGRRQSALRRQHPPRQGPAARDHEGRRLPQGAAQAGQGAPGRRRIASAAGDERAGRAAAPPAPRHGRRRAGRLHRRGPPHRRPPRRPL